MQTNDTFPKTTTLAQTAPTSVTPQGLAQLDYRPGTIQARALQAAIAASPRQVAQRQAVGAIQNSPWQVAQLQPSTEALSLTQGEVVQRVQWAAVERDRIRINGNGHDYTAYFDDEQAGQLELYEDNEDRMWINNVSVEDDLQGRGIGLAMLHAAVEEHGQVYAAVGMQNHEEANENDTRHLSTEGAALVSSAVRNGILQEDWCFNPAFGNVGDDEEMGEDEDMEELDPRLSYYEVITLIQNGQVSLAQVRQYADDDMGVVADLLRAADRRG